MMTMKRSCVVAVVCFGLSTGVAHAAPPETIDFGTDFDGDTVPPQAQPGIVGTAKKTAAPSAAAAGDTGSGVEKDFDSEVSGFSQSVDDKDTFLTNILGRFMTAMKSVARSTAFGSESLTVALLAWAVSQAAAKIGLRAGIAQFLWPFAASLVYAYAAAHAVELANWFANSIAAASNAASGAAIGPMQPGGLLSNPSELMDKAYKLVNQLNTMGMKHASDDAGVAETVGNFLDNFVTGISNTPIVFFVSPAVICGFAATAIISIKTVVHANAKILVGTTLMPFLVLPITRPVGMMGVGMVLTAAVELAVKSMLLGIGVSVLEGVSAGPDSDVLSFAQIAVAAWAVAAVCADIQVAFGAAMTAKRIF